MSQEYNWQRINKDKVRRAMWGWLKSERNGKPINDYLTLAGISDDGTLPGLDIYSGIKVGMVQPYTRVLTYEKVDNRAERIRRHFKKMSNVAVVTGALEDSKLRPHTFDFAYLDFFGCPNAKIFHWLHDTFAASLKLGAAFAITISPDRQQGALFDAIDGRLETDLINYKSFMAKHYPSIWWDDPRIGKWLFILKCALRNYSADLHSVLCYRDTTRMVLLVFKNIQALKPAEQRVFPELYPSSILRKENPMTKHSKAAYKAHATRQANARAKMLSARAKKAWRTRRAQA
jgi:hypothetical protein